MAREFKDVRGSAGGGNGYAEFLESGAGAALLFGAGIAFDDFTKFPDAGIFLAEFNQCHSFFQAGGSELETLGIVAEDLVVLGDGLLVLFLGVGDLAEIELGIGGEIGVAVILEVVSEFGAGEIVFAAGDVAEAVGIERIGGGRRTGRSSGSAVGCGGASASGGGGASGSAAGKARVNVLDGVL